MARCHREHAVLGSIAPGVRERRGILVERTGTKLGIGSFAAVWAQGPEMLPEQNMTITEVSCLTQRRPLEPFPSATGIKH